MDSSYSSSDSEDMLEDVVFLSARQQTESSAAEITDNDQVEIKPSIGSRLDELLSKHKEEEERDEQHQIIKAELLNAIEQGSQEDTSFAADDGEPLNGELAEHIEQLEVKSLTLPTGHPTITVFSPDKLCHLFKENINPFTCGFSMSHSSRIDRVVATIQQDTLIPVLQSNILQSCFHQISKPQSVMIWLLSVLSIHSSSLVVDLCSKNMANIIQNFHVDPDKNDSRSRGQLWYPKPLELIRILVNMGADPTYLLADETMYTDEVIREHLSVVIDENNSSHQPHGKFSMGNCRHLFEILTKCFQKRPDCTKEELGIIMSVITKVSFDDSFQNLQFQHNFHALLSSVLSCYSDADWPSVVPSLCHCLSRTVQHHHHAVYLSELMPLSIRGDYLQLRISFLLLCLVLEPERANEISALELYEVTPVTVAHLGHKPQENSELSQLYHSLQRLIEEDLYKMNSAVTLLDRAVGDEMNRNSQPKGELQYLTNQLKLVIKDIRDSFHTLDVLRVTTKDKMTIMTAKWMRMSAQHTKSVQRSMFSYLSSSSQSIIPEEKLKDELMNSEVDDMDI